MYVTRTIFISTYPINCVVVYHLFDKLDIPTMLQPQKLSLDTCDIFASKLEKLVTYSQPQFL